jgi:CheY-like chemotaxis protein
MTHQPTTVLIAEDDPVFRRVMGFSIARSGLTVESVGDGEAAYERLCRGGVDFLVTDHQMPICSGLELLDRLGAHQSLPQPPVILCTAKGLELDSQGLESRYGLVAVMHKPFSPRKLSELILQHIGASQFAATNKASSAAIPFQHTFADVSSSKAVGNG